MNNRNGARSILAYFLIIGAIAMIFFSIAGRNRNTDDYSHQDFLNDIKESNVTAVEVRPNSETPTGSLLISLKDGRVRTLYVSDTGNAEEELKELFPAYTSAEVSKESFLVSYGLPLLLSLVFFFILISFMNAQAGGGNSKMMSFGKSRAVRVEAKDQQITFKDVAGLDEEKEDLEEIVDFLKSPSKYTEMGARIPKGILLVGPPGTGKTLLAKAISGEAGVPFFSISGSDFVEMFVGVGASRVRDLFENAKRNSPCIVFIDEIDAVARRRGTGLGGGHDEREQTLNQLLVEMDGFGVNEGIIVLAATNRVDILDPAIMRPGRFDRKVAVVKPDVKGREAILKVHAQKKPLADEVDLHQTAQSTTGFTGADLENLLNEAAIMAAKEDRKFIKQEDIKRAFIKVGVGTEKKSRIVTDRDKKITAYHEAGHAVLFHILPEVGPVYTISIIPTGIGAAGYTMPLPEHDEEFLTRTRMMNEIIVSMGGRVAEDMFCGDITTGASQDLKQATKEARSMVTKYGMSEKMGVVSYDSGDEEVFIGRDMAHPRTHSEETAGEIDQEVKAIIDHCYKKAEELLSENREVLIRVAEELIKKERLTREEFEALFTETA